MAPPRRAAGRSPCCALVVATSLTSSLAIQALGTTSEAVCPATPSADSLCIYDAPALIQKEFDINRARKRSQKVEELDVEGPSRPVPHVEAAAALLQVAKYAKAAHNDAPHKVRATTLATVAPHGRLPPAPDESMLPRSEHKEADLMGVPVKHAQLPRDPGKQFIPPVRLQEIAAKHTQLPHDPGKELNSSAFTSQFEQVAATSPPEQAPSTVQLQAGATQAGSQVPVSTPTVVDQQECRDNDPLPPMAPVKDCASMKAMDMCNWNQAARQTALLVCRKTCGYCEASV